MISIAPPNEETISEVFLKKKKVLGETIVELAVRF